MSDPKKLISTEGNEEIVNHIVEKDTGAKIIGLIDFDVSMLFFLAYSIHICAFSVHHFY